MVVSVGFVWWDKARNVPVNEELARICAEYRRHMNATVTAGDDHGARALPLVSQPAVPGLVRLVSCGFPAMITLDQIRRQRFSVFHRRFPRRGDEHIEFERNAPRFARVINQFFAACK